MANSSKKVPSTSRDVFALLVPVSSEAEADGEVISAPEIGATWARRFTDQDVKRAQKALSKDEWASFCRLTHAYQALKAPDLFPEALKRTMRHYHEAEYHKEKANLSPEALQVGRNIADVVGLPPDESYMHLVGKAVGPRAQQDSMRMFAREAFSAFSLAYPVLWRENGLIRTAMHCMNARIALYGHQFFFPPIGGCRWVLCRGCELLFFQKDPRSLYHRKECGEKRRKARSRKNPRSS